VGCNLNTSNEEAAPRGFAFLANVGNVDDATVLHHLAPLRQARIWVPSPASPGVTDVRLHRVMASGGRGAVVEFRAGR
jgi:hypothetical protein